jgi:MFS family permease
MENAQPADSNSTHGRDDTKPSCNLLSIFNNISGQLSSSTKDNLKCAAWWALIIVVISLGVLVAPLLLQALPLVISSTTIATIIFGIFSAAAPMLNNVILDRIVDKSDNTSYKKPALSGGILFLTLGLQVMSVLAVAGLCLGLLATNPVGWALLGCMGLGSVLLLLAGGLFLLAGSGVSSTLTKALDEKWFRYTLCGIALAGVVVSGIGVIGACLPLVLGAGGFMFTLGLLGSVVGLAYGVWKGSRLMRPVDKEVIVPDNNITMPQL